MTSDSKLSPLFLLTLLLRFGGFAMLCALPMALLPTDWMASSHAWLGLGPFPQPAAPLVEYLARSISLLYGFHGGLLLVVSTDPRRFRPIVRYLGVMNILFGLGVLAIDLAVGLPMLWTLIEGPSVAITGVLFLFLAGRVEDR